MRDATPGWETVDAPPPLACGESHVWHIDLRAPSPTAWELLSPDEQARALQFRFAADRERFTRCRAKLRQILGQYLDQPPAQLAFQYGAHGKPKLPPAPSQQRIEFNVSHTGDAALFAFARERTVGVDLENATNRLDFQALADRFMSPREAAFVRAAADGDRSRAFYACWTRKEAWLKAIGCGLSEPLARFDASPALGQPTGMVRCDDFPALSWTLHELSPAPDLIAAVAAEGAPAKIKQLKESSAR